MKGKVAHAVMTMPVRWQMKQAVCDAYEAKNSPSSVLHGHHHFLLTLITRGHGIQILNGREIPFGPNDLFLLSPADFHQNTLPIGESFDHFGVRFPYELLDARLSEFCALDRFPMHLHLSDRSAAVARTVFAQLVEESRYGADRPANRVYLQSLVEQLFIIALREMPADCTAGSDVFINKALGYLHSHFYEAITVSDAAAYAGYTPNYFNTCFREQMGVPFGAYLRQTRLTYAQNLLRASKMSVTEIALESGFGSLSHFSRSFHEVYGVSPLEYRNSIVKQESKPV